VIGLTGLQNYKFGRSVTVPFLENGVTADTPYKVIVENKKRGLHTFCFLDIKVDEKRYMAVKDGLNALLTAEGKNKRNIITQDTLAVGVARAGAPDFCVRADYIRELLKYDFGSTPHTLVFPAKLHFMEAEALITLADAPKKVLEMT